MGDGSAEGAEPDGGSAEADAVDHLAVATSEASAEDGESAAVTKVVNFVRSARSLVAFSGPDLDRLLHDWRFELLGLPFLGDEVQDARGVHLPAFSDIPSREELHEVLVSGKVPGMHQRIAHMLHPDSVPWPEQESDQRTDPSPSPAADEEDGPADGTEQSAQSPAASGRLGSRHQPERAPRASSTPRAVRLDASAAAQSDSSACRAAQVSSIARVARTHTMRPEVIARRKNSLTTAVTLRGQKVTSTVLSGHPRSSRDTPREDPLALAAGDLDTARLREARERRKELDKAARLEEYQEKRLEEQIRELETLRDIHLENASRALKRKEQRKAHNEELKKRLDEGISRKLQEEKAAEKVRQEEREREAERDKRTTEYHSRQKERVKEWHLSRSESPRGGRSKSEQAGRDPERRTFKATSQRALDAEEWARAAQEAFERRPPLPPARAPRRHDLPSPRVAGEAMDSTLVSPRLRLPVKVQTKVVCKTLGLTDEQHKTVDYLTTPMPAGTGWPRAMQK